MNGSLSSVVAVVTVGGGRSMDAALVAICRLEDDEEAKEVRLSTLLLLAMEGNDGVGRSSVEG